MKVPMLDPSKFNKSIEAELIHQATSVIQGGHYILGETVSDFEAACGEFLGTHFAVGVSSGTDALLVSLMALGIGPGDKVACPSFTFFATAGSIARLGAEPVFLDVDKDSFNSPVSEYERVASMPGMKAFIPVHLFGRPADIGEIVTLATNNNLRVVEDVAQAFGSDSGGEMCGTWGDFGCFSFFPSKNLGGFGDGGLVTTNSPDLYRKVLSLRNHGAGELPYHYSVVGGNFRLDALQAALLSVKLQGVQYANSVRRRHAMLYRGYLAGTSILTPLQGYGGTYNQFTIRVPGGARDSLVKHLTNLGIGCAVYYPRPLHMQECFSYNGPPLPNCVELASEVLSIPIAPELSVEQIGYVAEAIIDFDRMYL